MVCWLWLPGDGDDVVEVLDGHGFGKELIDFAGHSGAGSPGEVVLVVAAAGSLGERDDAGGVVLVPAEADGLTAVVNEAVGQDFAEGADNLFGVLGPGLQLGDDMRSHRGLLLIWSVRNVSPAANRGDLQRGNWSMMLL